MNGEEFESEMQLLRRRPIVNNSAFIAYNWLRTSPLAYSAEESDMVRLLLEESASLMGLLGESVGIDSGPLHEVARVWSEIARNPKTREMLREDQCRELKPPQHWPEILGERLYDLPQGQQIAIRESYGCLERIVNSYFTEPDTKNKSDGNPTSETPETPEQWPVERVVLEFDAARCQVKYRGCWYDVNENAYTLLSACWEGYPSPISASHLEGNVRPDRVAKSLPPALKSILRSEKGKGCFLKFE